MLKKTFSLLMLMLLLMSMLTLAFDIQPVEAEGPIYIRADGSIDPPTAPIQRDGDTYTLTENITSNPDGDGIIVQRDNVIINGDGYTIIGLNGYGVNLQSRRNVTITNVTVMGFRNGIRLSYSSDNNLTGNKMTGRSVIVSHSDRNTIACNVAGVIGLVFSSNNSLTGNVLNGFVVSGMTLDHFVHSIDDSNTVDGKPVYYLLNQKDLVVTPQAFPNIGYLALVNSTNVTVENLTLSNAYQGMMFAYTNNSRIAESIITNSFQGIYLYESCNNSIASNLLTANEYGMYLDNSENNIVSGNVLANNNPVGMFIWSSSNCTLVDNVAFDNYCNLLIDGWLLSHFMHSIDTSNMIDGKPVYYLDNKQDLDINPTTYPSVGYLALVSCTGISVQNMNLTHKGTGLLLVNTNNSRIEANTISDSYEYGLSLISSSNNTISENYVVNNDGVFGIYLVVNSTGNTISKNVISGNGYGIFFDNMFWSICRGRVNYNTIVENRITNNGVGILLQYLAENNLVTGNDISDNGHGIEITASKNSIVKNNVTRNSQGIRFNGSDANYNSIVENNVSQNNYGISIDHAHDNEFYNNNFIDNLQHVIVYNPPSIGANYWDGGYPVGGNFWSGCTGDDLYCGPYQNLTGSDGMGDVPLIMDSNNQDHYPLMSPWVTPQTENASSSNQTYPVDMSSNATIQDFTYEDTSKTMNFTLSGGFGSIAYCRLAFQKELMIGTLAVLVNGTAIDYSFTENSTHYFLYFTCHLSLDNVTILQTVLGDINGDRKVDVKDVYAVAKAYGSSMEGPDPPGHPWNPLCDINGDGKVDVKDYYIVCKSFGKTYT